jgi:ribonuclease Z
MLDVYLLGTGGTIPLLKRRLSSGFLRANGKGILIDCGEGTQLALRECGLGFKGIDVICLTHFHADHTGGIAGLMLTMADSGRSEPVVMIGPARLSYVVHSLLVIAPHLPFDIVFHEIEKSGQTFDVCGMRITAFELSHNIPCYGYAFEVKRAPRFLPEKALELGIPQKQWGKLQRGETVRVGLKFFRPRQVLGQAREGLKVAYATDTRPVPAIAQYAKDADILILEGMYGGDDEREKAVERGHMTFSEAVELAAQAGAKALWLTHYSPSLKDPLEHISAAARVFPNAQAGYDGLHAFLTFRDE